MKYHIWKGVSGTWYVTAKDGCGNMRDDVLDLAFDTYDEARQYVAEKLGG